MESEEYTRFLEIASQYDAELFEQTMGDISTTTISSSPSSQPLTLEQEQLNIVQSQIPSITSTQSLLDEITTTTPTKKIKNNGKNAA